VEWDKVILFRLDVDVVKICDRTNTIHIFGFVTMVLEILVEIYNRLVVWIHAGNTRNDANCERKSSSDVWISRRWETSSTFQASPGTQSPISRGFTRISHACTIEHGSIQDVSCQNEFAFQIFQELDFKNLSRENNTTREDSEDGNSSQIAVVYNLFLELWE
jgi:hypothetical protein